MREPIAIIGIGCRFPGGIHSPETFWRALCEGRDVIGEVPEDRWDLKALYHPNRDKSGTVYTRKGGFLESIDQFDPQFFGISPREAPFVDPQQRLLLEVAWEAMEDGGQAPEALAGSQIGVFIGLFVHDYENILSGASERKLFGPHSATGMSTTIAANRLSYIFDFKGPSMVVDTACSSSLVAVHLACRSIWENESEMALAGGVNALLRPEMTMALCRASFLSEDGYCKSFDAAADGYTRSEGAGMVLLKPLSRAMADGDPVVAVIRGSAVNQDGKSAGLTVPGASSQIAVISKALESAGVGPETIRYVEAHGTGTPVGDPIEARAIGTVLSQNRSAENACIIGSVKSNIGHTESAAGIASLIKTALILFHGRIPPNLHFNTPNPQIPFEELKLRVPVVLEPWPEIGGPRLAGINSFGFGGTNAHVVLEGVTPSGQPVQPAGELAVESNPEPGPAVIVPLSARSPEALDAHVDGLIRHLPPASQKEGFVISDLGYTSALRRSHHPYRLAVAARDMESLTEHLNAWRNGESRPGMAAGHAVSGRGVSPVFVFSGMGPQWWNMGRELFQLEAEFRKVILACDRLFGRHTKSWSVVGEIEADESASRIGETRIAQPCIFSLQVALAGLWRSWGVVPGQVLGHSIGEIAAAHVAGILSLEDAVRICFHRGRLLQKRDGCGSMLAVGIGLADAERLIADVSATVSVGAVNSPDSVTLSGETAALAQIAQSLENRGIFARMLNVTVPYHSPILDPILAEFEEALSLIRPNAGHISMVSTVTGGPIDGEKLDAAYWRQNLRQPVLFSTAFHHLLQSGQNTFIEIAPHPVLAPSMRECAAATAHEAVFLPSLRRGQPEDLIIRGALGALYTMGFPVAWDSICPEAGRFVKLPAYPWQKAGYWSESDTSKRIRRGLQAPGGAASLQPANHPLLGSRLDTALPTWQAEMDMDRLAYLRDHRIDKSIVFPAAAHIEIGLAAGLEIYGASGCGIRDLDIVSPLILKDDKEAAVQMAVKEDGRFSVHGKSAAGDGRWTLHASGKAERSGSRRISRTVDLHAIRNRCDKKMSSADCYQRSLAQNIDYGPEFQGIDSLWTNEEEAVARFRFSATVTAELDRYRFHPVVLDNGFQALAALSVEGTYLPVAIERVSVHERPKTDCWCHARITERKNALVKGDLDWYDAEGNLLAEISGLTCRRMATSDEASGKAIAGHLYRYRWKRTSPIATGETAGADSENLPSPASVAEAIGPVASALAAEYNRDRYYSSIEPKLDRLSALYMAEAFESLGWKGFQTEELRIDDIAGKLGVAEAQQPFISFLADTLFRDETRKAHGDHSDDFSADAALTADDLWAKTLAAHPDLLAELSLLRRCGSHLADVMTGKADPRSIVFDPESAAADQLFHSSPTCRIYNELMQKTIQALLAHLPAGEPFRILEIGAGSGALASHVLPLLPTDCSTYCLTDNSQDLVQAAENRFRAFDFLSCRTLDIDGDPLKQGFLPNSFDVILSFGAIHTTPDIGRTFENIKRLLSSRGLLIMAEPNRAPRWFHLVFGMLEEWWGLSDRVLRPHHPLLSGVKWSQALDRFGFADTAILSDLQDPSGALYHIILAKGPEIAPEKIRYRDDPPTGETILRNEKDSAPVIILADRIGVADRLAESFRQAGGAPILFPQDIGSGQRTPCLTAIDVHRPEDIERVLDAATKNAERSPAIVCLWPLEKNPDRLSSTDAILPVCYAVLRVFQWLTSRAWEDVPSLWLVTGGAQQAGGMRKIQPTPNTIWGLGRVMSTEHPDLMTRLVDLSPVPGAEEINALCREVISNDGEDEIALRKDRRYIHRLCRLTNFPQSHTAGFTYRLEPTGRSGFDAYAFRETRRELPGARNVEIAIRAAGINFKDVAKASGILDTAASSGRLGLECAGTVTAVGSEVKHFHPGDAVMGLVLECVAGHSVTDPKALVKIPDGVSFEAAATVPIVFLSAWYALHRLARINKGDRVLIHTATGGVGLAAIQVAHAAGGEVLATAGTPEKRAFLRAMGIGYVGDSRSTEFAEEIMAHTRGRGVDIVINTLPIHTLEASLSVLRPLHGRLVDIGNVFEKSIPITSPGKGISFYTFDLEDILKNHPALAGELLEEIAERISDGTFSPLPYRVFPVSTVSTALRRMSKGTHIGKMILTMSDPCVFPEPTSNVLFPDADGTYLITGGLGGLGLSIAMWLISCGAKHLMLVGRSGAATDEAKTAVSSMQQTGADVRIASVDITQKEAVASLLAQMEREMPPLKGIVHAAMVLEDAPLQKTTRSQMKNVMAPKIDGALHLHEQTLGCPLDFFICFSSFASIVGNADQGGYAAANAFLDALAVYRRSMSLPALTVGWGPIGEAGYVARNDAIHTHLRRQGIDIISLEQVFRVIRFGLAVNADHLGMIPANWQQMRRYSVSVDRSPRFSEIIPPIEADDDRARTTRAADVLSCPPERRRRVIEELMAVEVAAVLGLSMDELRHDQPIEELGFDSLMAVELVVRIEAVTRLSVPKMMLLNKGLTVSSLAELIEGELPDLPADPAAGNGPVEKRGLQPGTSPRPVMADSNGTPPASEEIDVNALSDEEVDAMLQSMLTGKGAAHE